MGKQRITGDPIKQYDSFFEAFDAVKNKKSNSNLGSAMAPTFQGFDTGFGKSKYDETFNWNADADEDDIKDSINENRAQEQSGLGQLGLGAVRATTKALTEVAKLPGVVGGIIAAPFAEEGEGMDTAFNNWWIKGLEGVNEKINADLLPVYTAKAVREGNLWDNISSTSFWATDGADGLGFIAAMMAPGAIFEYAGLGGKLLNAGRNASKFAGMTEKTEAAVTALKAMGITGKSIDAGFAVAGNTIFEAGAEAKGVGDDLDRKKSDFIKVYIGTKDHQEKVSKKLEELDIQRRTGQIDLNTYNQLSTNVSNIVAEENFKEQRALAMRNTFVSNVGILLGPNAMMHKAIWGKAGKTFVKEAETGSKEVLKRINKAGQRFAGATASEGFWEEGSQSTVENMYVNKAMNNKLGKKDDRSYLEQANEMVGDFTKEYVNTIGSTDGQKAILLGGVFGGGMTSFQGRKSDVENRKQTNKVLDGVEQQITHFNTLFDNDVYRKDENGDFVYKKDKEGNDTTERELDNTKVAEVAKSLNFTEQQSQLFDVAVRTGNTKVVETLKQQAIFNMILPAIHNGEMGIQALEQKLNENSKFNEIVERDKTADEKDKAKAFVKDTLETARHLQKQNEKFGDFSKDIITLKNDKATDKQKEEFLNRLNASYLNVKHQLRQDEKSLKDLEEKRNNIFEELGIDPLYDAEAEFPTAKMKNGTITDEELEKRATKTRDALNSNNDLLNKTQKEYSEVKNRIEKAKKDVSAIWNGNNINESFNQYVERQNKEVEKFSPEKIQEADDLINGIKGTSDKNQLDTLLLPAHKPQPTIDDYEKEIEHKTISEISDSINNDDSIENLKFNLEKLKSLTITSLKLNDVINDLEEKLSTRLQEIEDFKDFLINTIDIFNKETKELNDFLLNLNSEIDDLLKQKQVLLKALEEQSKSPKGRYAKLIKDLIKDSQESLRKIENKIESLNSLKEEVKSELKQTSKNIEYIFNRYDQIDKTDFNSISDVIDYLETNKELFKDHRHSLERLLATKLTSEEHIEYLDHSIEILEGYAEVLRSTIKSFLTVDGKIKTESVEDHKFIKEELIATTKKLQESKKELKNEKEKLGRLNKAVIDKLSINSINDELDFWNDLKDYREKNINPLINNPAIQEVIEQKKEEFKQQEDEELTQSEEDQINLEEEEVLNNPEEVVETIEPTVTLDEEGQFQSESLPTTENEDEDNEVVEAENMSEEEVDKALNKEVSGAKIISTNRETGEALYDNLQAFVDYERYPRDKSEDIVTFSNGDISNGDVELAYNKLIKGVKLSDKEIKLLEDKLPIRVDISYLDGKDSKTVSSFIEAKTKANQSNVDSKEMFEQQTMPLRKNIIEQAIKNKSLEGIQSNIVKQYPGLLTVDYNEEGVAKNDIFSLQVFDGMSEDEKVDYFQKNTAFVDWKGNLVSTLNKDRNIRTNFGVSHKGEVFLRIPQNNGTDFWLKLNVAKISEAKAEAVYEIVNALSQVSQSINSPTSFQAMTIDTFFDTLAETDPNLSEKIKKTLAYEIALVKTFNKGKAKNESLSRFLDLIVYHKSLNSKTGFSLSKDGNLKLGSLAMHLMDGMGFKHSLTITKGELNTPETKQIIMDYVQYKRHNILITRDSPGLFVFNNKEYVKYLLNENEPLLTTNAVVNQPTFQGYSNVYLNQDVSNTVDENKSTKQKNPKKPKGVVKEDIVEEIVVEPVDISIENEQGENLKTKAAFEALLKVKSEPKSKEEVKMDIDYIKESYKKASEDTKSEIIFALAENLNSVDDINFEDLTKTFNKLIDKAVKANKSIEEINKICGF